MVAVEIVAVFVLARRVLIVYRFVEVTVKIVKKPGRTFLLSRPAVSSIQLDIDALSFSEEASELSSSSDESAAVDSPVSESESTLPSFVRIADNLNFVWGDVDGTTFSSLLD